MSLAYDEVIEAALDTCERLPSFAAVERALVVRTVEGRVRVALRLADAGADDVRGEVERALETALKGWFAGPVIATTVGPRGHQQLAKQLIKNADGRVAASSWDNAWPPGWAKDIGRTGEGPRPLAPRWLALQVTLGKDPWLDNAGAGPATPPWPMRADQPTITAFYGFKGGVGRTTTLAVLAYQLARRGDRVVCVDLDLEAPGLTRLLLPDDLAGDGGWVIDDLLSAAATGSGLDRLPVVPVEVHEVGFHLAPAGVLGPTYLEKLARLDTLHRDAGQSPIHAALISLLKRIRAELSPRHIFLDCRSGLHDLAGLALHDLAHVDVLVGRGDRQELDGLGVLLPSLFRRRRDADRRVLVLRTLLRFPVEDSTRDKHRSALYDLFVQHLYDPDDPPSPNDEGVPHDPCTIVDQGEQISRAPWLGAIDQSALDHAHYREVLSRLAALWAPEGD